MSRQPLGRFTTFLLVPLCACSTAPDLTPTDEPPVVLERRFDCNATVASRTVECNSIRDATVPVSTPDADRVVGAEPGAIAFDPADVSFEPATSRFEVDLAIRNLLPEVLGSPAGEPAFRVFVHRGPAPTVGTGTVVLVDSDGLDYFTGPAQPFLAYSSAISPGGRGAPRRWTFAIHGTVTAFGFTVYAAIPLVPRGPDPNPAPFGYKALSAGIDHTCGIGADDLVYCWGYGGYGALGTGGTLRSLAPRPAATMERFRVVSAGGYHTCGVTVLDAAYCWGWNSRGQLGADPGAARCGEQPCALTPVRIAGLALRTLDAGGEHTCGLDPAGRAWCWGANGFGQLGDGSTVDRPVPVAVAGGLRFVAIRAGGFHTCGVSETGEVYCWGQNGSGQLGALAAEVCGSPVPAPCVTTPTRVPSLTAVAVDAGTLHSCALDALGRAFCWGSNRHRQLGDGTIDSRAVPTAVATADRFTALSAGTRQTCAITVEGRFGCWGGTELAPPGGTWIWVTAHDDHRCGIQIGGLAFCWGNEEQGELGNGGGHEEQHSMPQPVAPPVRSQ